MAAVYELNPAMVDVDQKLVSILMPVRDEAQYIIEALQSVLSQSYRNLEVIVVDDNSTDDTYAIVEQIAMRDPRVFLQRAQGDGKVQAFNQAWRSSSGDVVVLFAGDDVMPSDSIENRVQLLEKGFKDVATGKVRSFSTNAKYDGLILPRRGPSLGGGATAFSRKFCDMMFPIPEELPNEDSWTKLHIDAFGSYAWNEKVVSLYRIHEGNSMAFGSSWETKRSVLDKRSHAYELFLRKYKDNLTSDSIVRIQALAMLNRLRSEGRFLGILGLGHIPLRQKLAAISYCNPMFYALRVALERHLLGR